jgi:hypothetical protein
MGCGDGTLLAYIFRYVLDNTERGRKIKEQPERYMLMMVGVDLNDASLTLTHDRLEQEKIPHLMLKGDVGNPARLAEKISRHGLNLQGGLHVRSFTDHDRDNIMPQDADAAKAYEGLPFQPYLTRDGNIVSAASFQQNLLEHLKRWRNENPRHGMIVIEHHTLTPEVEAKWTGRSPITSHNAIHGFSGQNSTPYELFLKAAEEAHLAASFTQLKSSIDEATISVNYFTPV